MRVAFVYGTLMKGFGNHERLIKDARFIGLGETQPQFRMISLGSFPGVLNGGATSIHGELYEVTDEQVKQMDYLEGHPDFYRRTEITLNNGQEVETYLLQPRGHLEGYEEIPTGDWRGWLKQQE